MLPREILFGNGRYGIVWEILGPGMDGTGSPGIPVLYRTVGEISHSVVTLVNTSLTFAETAVTWNLTNTVFGLLIGVMDYNQGIMNQNEYEFLDGTTVPSFNQWDPSFVTGNGTQWCTKIDVETGLWIQIRCNDTVLTLYDYAYPVCEMPPDITYTYNSFGWFFCLSQHKPKVEKICAVKHRVKLGIRCPVLFQFWLIE